MTSAAGQSVDTIEKRIGGRVAIERVVRNREKIEPDLNLALERGDEVVLTGPAAALIGAAAWLVRRFAGNRLGANANRGRMPRLAVIDAAAVDGLRRLVLVRRDNI